MDLGLAGKRAVITGATKGLGLRIARQLLDEGMALAFCARNTADVEAAQQAFSAGGRCTRGWACDVRDAAAYAAFLNEARDWLSGVDAFIPNVSAKGGPGGEEVWRALFEVDILGAVRGVESLRDALEASRGAVLFMCTTAAIEHFPVVQPYNVMKATLIAYAKQLSQSLGPKGVRVNCISPGSILYEGSNWERARDAGAPVYEAVRRSIPEGRLGTAEEVARVAAFLLSPAASWITGENIVIDGGQTKRVHY